MHLFGRSGLDFKSTHVQKSGWRPPGYHPNQRFDGHRLSFPQPFDDAHDAMGTLVWHRDQKAVSALILDICTEA